MSTDQKGWTDKKLWRKGGREGSSTKRERTKGIVIKKMIYPDLEIGISNVGEFALAF